MKNVIFVFFIIGTILTKSFGQSTLETLFVKLPYGELEELNTKNRLEAIRNYSEGDFIFFVDTGTNDFWIKFDPSKPMFGNNVPETRFQFTLKEFLPRNGFLTIEKQYPASENRALLDMCYWNVSDGSKLIAINDHFTQCCGLSKSMLSFYKYVNGSITELSEINILPSPTFDDIIETEELSISAEELAEFKIIFSKALASSYELPIQGKNIILNLTVSEDFIKNQKQLRIIKKCLRSYKSSITYIWNDGTFIIKK